MKLEIKSNHLLNAVLHLSKISKLNENNKSLLLDADNGFVELIASSSELYGQGILDANIVEPGISMLPLTIIPYLQGFGEKVISLSIDLDKVVIKEKKNKIKLSQIGGNITDFSRRDYRPVWSNVRLDRLSHVIYASGIEAHGLSFVWFNDKHIICSDRYRVAIYNPKGLVNTDFSIQTRFMKFLPKTELEFAPEKEIWFGNDGLNISVPKVQDNKLPKPLKDLSEQDKDLKLCLVNKDQLSFAVDSAFRLIDNMFFSCDLSINEDGWLKVSTDTGSGESDISVPILLDESTEPIDIRVNTRYLKETLDNCVGKQVWIGIYKNIIPYLTVRDEELEHFILPLVK